MRTADIRKTLTNPRPLYAVAGAGDLAVEKLRKAVPPRIAALRGELQVQPRAVRGGVTERLEHVPGDVRRLPERTRVFARTRLTAVGDTYAGLTERGKGAVERLRRSRPTPEHDQTKIAQQVESIPEKDD